MSKIINKNEKIILVGLNDKQLNNIPKNIIGIKKTNSQKELVEIYSTVDVFINPTLEDNFPTTNLESTACGTPVITFDSGGCPETVDQHSGIVVNKGNLNEIHKAIKTIKENGKEKYTVSCTKRAKKLLDKENMIVQYLNLYNDIK